MYLSICSSSRLRLRLRACSCSPLMVAALLRGNNCRALMSGVLLSSAMLANTVQAAEYYFDPNSVELREGQQAVDLNRFATGGQLPGNYYVDILINGEMFESRNVEFISAADGSTLLPRLTVADLKAMGVKIEKASALALMPDSAEVTDLGSLIPDAGTRLNFNQLRLNVSVPQAAMDSRPRNSIDPSLWDQGLPALMFNYSASGSQATRDDVTTNNNFLRLNTGLNLGAWRLRNNSTYTSSGGSDTSGDADGWETLDTYLQRDIHSLKSQLVLGESTSSGEVFDSVQFRGFQLASDDNMLPDSLRGFAPVVRGIAKTDAQVTVRQNGYVIYQAQVAPGAFAISDLYPSASSGNLDVTVREADGSETTFVQPFSAVPIMQREGGLKYSITGGQYRSYSDDVATPDFVQSSIIYGLSNYLTLYAGTQLADNYRSFLAGTGIGLGDWGSLSLDVTQANSTLQDDSEHSGRSLRVQYAKDVFQSGTTFTLAGYRYSTEGFYDFREANEIWTSDEEDQWRSFYNKRSKVTVQINQSLDQFGSIYLTGLQQDYWGQDDKERTLMAGYNGSYKGVTFGLTYTATQMPNSERDQQLSFSVQVPLGGSGSSTYASYQLDTDGNGRTSNQVGVSGTALESNNLSYSASESYANQGEGNAGRARMDYRGRYGAVGGAYSYGNDAETLSYTLSGAVVAHPYGVTLSQSLGESSVLVRAPGAAGVDLQNKTGVSTDPWGYAVMPYASAYRKNRVSLDPSSLSEDVDIDIFTKTAIPTRGALVLAEFDTRVGGRALLTLNFKDRPVPFGATATVVQEGKPNSSIVAGAGEVYLSGLPEEGQLQVKWGDRADEHCTASYTLPVREDSAVYVRSTHVVCQ